MQETGGTATAGAQRTRPIPPLQRPFASSERVEHEHLRAIPLGTAAAAPDGLAFLDGIQRYGVEGWYGLAPVVRGYVAAAVVRRRGGALAAAVVEREEFLIAPLARLSAQQRGALETFGLTLRDLSDAARPHPILDVQHAATLVERRREAVERHVAHRYLDECDGWLVVDGAITSLADRFERHERLVGIVKSHETQYVNDADLAVVLNLPEGHRTSVIARGSEERARVYTWYLRLWSWEDRDVLHGLVRIERPPVTTAVREATTVSRWLLAERAPVAGTDGRWDRLLYPIQQVETLLRAQAGNW